MPQGSDLVVVAIGLPVFGLAVYLWAVAAFNMYGTLKNFAPGKEWGKYVFVSIFMPSLFTEVGKRHRKKMLRYARYFLLYLAVLFLGGLLLKYLLAGSS